MSDSKALAPRAVADDVLNNIHDKAVEVLPQTVDQCRMLRIFANAISTTPKLAQCTRGSLATALMTAAQFGLEPNTPLGECYIIPYKDTASFQPGYQGILKLAYQSGRVSGVYAEKVCENDEFEIALGTEKRIRHIPVGNRGDAIGYYAVVRFNEFEPHFHYMTLTEIESHRDQFSRAYGYDKKGSTWATNFDAMAKKTVLIQALKYAPKSIDDKLARIVHADDDITFAPKAERRKCETVDDLLGEQESPTFDLPG